MPLKKGKSKKVMKDNFHEIRHSDLYEKTKKKFGKKKAQSQMIAIVLQKAGKSRKRNKRSQKGKR